MRLRPTPEQLRHDDAMLRMPRPLLLAGRPFPRPHIDHGVAVAVDDTGIRRRVAPANGDSCASRRAESASLARMGSDLEALAAVLAFELNAGDALLALPSSFDGVTARDRAIERPAPPLTLRDFPSLALELLAAVSTLDGHQRSRLSRPRRLRRVTSRRAVPPLARRRHLEGGAACEAQTLLVHTSHATALPTWSVQDNRTSTNPVGR